jgi:hypothetical protein
MVAERSSAASADHSPESGDKDHAAEQRLASEIYGLIIASSVLAAGTDDHNILHVALSVFVTLVVYWLAETYAHVIAAHHVRGQKIWWHTRRELRAGWPLVSASFIPLVTVIVAALFGATVDTAQTVGMVATTALLFAAGWIAARRNDLAGFRPVLAAALAAGLGVVLIGLKTALH